MKTIINLLVVVVSINFFTNKIFSIHNAIIYLKFFLFAWWGMMKHTFQGELLYGFGGRKLYQYSIFKPLEGYFK